MCLRHSLAQPHVTAPFLEFNLLIVLSYFVASAALVPQSAPQDKKEALKKKNQEALLKRKETLKHQKCAFVALPLCASAVFLHELLTATVTILPP